MDVLEATTNRIRELCEGAIFTFHFRIRTRSPLLFDKGRRV